MRYKDWPVITDEEELVRIKEYTEASVILSGVLEKRKLQEISILYLLEEQNDGSFKPHVAVGGTLEILHDPLLNKVAELIITQDIKAVYGYIPTFISTPFMSFNSVKALNAKFVVSSPSSHAYLVSYFLLSELFSEHGYDLDSFLP